ncbi:MAG: hypothetical protein SVX28_12690, partial [Pseudomonadota bacterium]|nr:hypothetical protein [Pseudomonadota bacterium]
MAVGNGPENIGSLEALYKKCERIDDWLFGYLTYDLKNELEALSSNNFDGLGFAALQFFVPE